MDSLLDVIILAIGFGLDNRIFAGKKRTIF
jgi:hypothetical protein